MGTPFKVFLDLEDTIITSWEDKVLINVDAIHAWLDSRLDDHRTIQIFSFAIWDDKDKKHFVDSGMKTMIEKALNVEVTEWLSIEEMQQIVEEWSGIRFLDRLDFMQLHGKHWSFIKVCLAREQNHRCILVDDAVPHRTTFDHTRQLTIELLPVQTIIGQPLQELQLDL
jgi:hypothetical protein